MQLELLKLAVSTVLIRDGTHELQAGSWDCRVADLWKYHLRGRGSVKGSQKDMKGQPEQFWWVQLLTWTHTRLTLLGSGG